MERPTHHQQWDRIALLAPLLRPGVVMHRRRFRYRRSYVLHDPAANQFFRVDPVSHYFVSLFDGRCTVDEAWQRVSERFGDEAPTQGEVFSLISQLYHLNLIAFAGLNDAAQLFARLQRRRSAKRKQQASNFLFVRMPLFDPAAALDWLMPLVRPLLSWWGLALWAVLLTFGVVQLLPNWEMLWDEARLLLRPSNLPWLALLYILIKAAHEFGHGLMCRRFGGEVHEMGIMLLVFLPVPYCDATSSWSFAHRGQRALVGLGGILVETAIAAVAAIVWVYTAPETMAHELAHNMIFLAGFTTIVFNANPLLRYDGYYILTDTLDIPNLWKRANSHLGYLWKRWVFGMTQQRPVARGLRETVWLTLYGCSSWVYRLLVMVAIVWFVSMQFFGLGLLLAAGAVMAWAVLPLGKLARYLAASPELAAVRARAVGVTLGVAALAVVLLGLVPARQFGYANAVIERPRQVMLVFGSEGFVENVLAQDGQAVEAGQVILQARNPALDARRAEVLADIVRHEVAFNAALESRPQDEAKARVALEALRTRLAALDDQIARLTLTSPVAGMLVAPALDRVEGQFLTRGSSLGEVRGGAGMIARAIVPQTESALLGRINGVRVMTRGQVGQALEGHIEKISVAGSESLRYVSMGVAAGGEVRTAVADTTGRRATEKLFEVRVRIDETTTAPPGQRAKVRFEFERQPLGVQWWRKLQQVIASRPLV